MCILPEYCSLIACLQVQLLHCIAQHVGSGGENIFADSFHVAELIRSRRPDLFQLLCAAPFEFVDVGVETESRDECRFHKIHERAMIRSEAAIPDYHWSE